MRETHCHFAESERAQVLVLLEGKPGRGPHFARCKWTSHVQRAPGRLVVVVVVVAAYSLVRYYSTLSLCKCQGV